LIGNVSLKQEHLTLHGERIEYDTRLRKIKAGGDHEKPRVKMIYTKE
jgi:lipopolysaccharide export system protein LptA